MPSARRRRKRARAWTGSPACTRPPSRSTSTPAPREKNASPMDMNRETWSAIIDESHKKGLKVAVHVYYHKDAKAAIDDGVDIIAHSIRDQDVTPELVAEMKQKNVSYIPTLTRDLSVFVYESTPDFIKDPFFLRGMSLYKDQVAIVTAPA